MHTDYVVVPVVHTRENDMSIHLWGRVAHRGDVTAARKSRRHRIWWAVVEFPGGVDAADREFRHQTRYQTLSLFLAVDRAGEFAESATCGDTASVYIYDPWGVYEEEGHNPLLNPFGPLKAPHGKRPPASAHIYLYR